ncbi:hypothetical protein AK812_SmicGene48816, partial [Symbiodinium microadriaticum]
MDEHAKQFSNRVGNIDGQMSRLVGCLEVQQQQSQDLLETFRELQAFTDEAAKNAVASRPLGSVRGKWFMILGHVEEQQSQGEPTGLELALNACLQELFDTRFRELQ